MNNNGQETAEKKPEKLEKPKKKAGFNFTMQSIFRKRIPLAEQVLFTKHLSMMLTAGISEVESLRIIKEQTQNKVFQGMLDRVITKVERGQFLSESLNEAENAFGELFINVVKLGEVSGTLPENLDYLSDEIKKKQELRSKVKGAMVYPIIVLTITAAVVSSLVIFVLPKITPIFLSLKVELPFTTRLLLNSSEQLRNNWLLVMIGLIAAVVGFKMVMTVKSVKYWANRMLLEVPLVGKMVLEYNVSNIARTLGLLLRSGVEIVEAVTSTANSVSNPVYKDMLMKAVEDVRKGRTLHTFFEKEIRFFPPTFTRMVQIGERTGNLTHNLQYLAKFYEEELTEKIRNLSSVFEPFLMVILGLLVGFVALSIITPIYEITQKIA